MRTSKEVAQELGAVMDEVQVLQDRARALNAELSEARLAEAAASPHEWLGKKVERDQPRGYRGRTVVQRGVVTLYDPKQHSNLLGLYSIQAGAAFVISASGRTGYRLEKPSFSRDGEWRLA